MIETILVPTDGSENSEEALEMAIEIARPQGASIHALSVRAQFPSESMGNESHSDSNDRAEDAISRARAVVEDAGIPFEGTIATGLPHEEITEFVSQNDVDMIVMGTQGRTGLKRVVIGSVAEKTIRNSPIPVLTVPATD